MNTLHLCASHWYKAQGLQLEAFQHAATANGVERAVRLMGRQGIPVHHYGAMTTILNWLALLPLTVLNARPWLLVRYASGLVVIGQTTGVEEKLQAAEKALQGAEPDGKTRDLVGQIAAVRAVLALDHNRVEPTLAQSRRALDYLPTARCIQMSQTSCRLADGSWEQLSSSPLLCEALVPERLQRTHV